MKSFYVLFSFSFYHDHCDCFALLAALPVCQRYADSRNEKCKNLEITNNHKAIRFLFRETTSESSPFWWSLSLEPFWPSPAWFRSPGRIFLMSSLAPSSTFTSTFAPTRFTWNFRMRRNTNFPKFSEMSKSCAMKNG